MAKLSKSAATAVSFVKQDTYLGIDEKGTEAAAVTTIGMTGAYQDQLEPLANYLRPTIRNHHQRKNIEYDSFHGKNHESG